MSYRDQKLYQYRARRVFWACDGTEGLLRSISSTGTVQVSAHYFTTTGTATGTATTILLLLLLLPHYYHTTTTTTTTTTTAASTTTTTTNTATIFRCFRCRTGPEL